MLGKFGSKEKRRCYSMKTEEEILRAIESYKERISDHHILLNEPIVRNTIWAVYESIIETLNWVLEDSQSSASTARKQE